MPRTITASGIAEAGKQEVYYTELFNIELPGQPHLHLTPSLPTMNSGIAFQIGDIEYRSAGISRGSVKSSSDTEVDGVTVSFQNVDQAFGALVENLELRGAFVTISGAFLDPDTLTIDPNHIFPVFQGKVGGMRITETAVNVDLDFAIKDIQVDVPRRFYGQGDGFFWAPPLV